MYAQPGLRPGLGNTMSSGYRTASERNSNNSTGIPYKELGQGTGSGSGRGLGDVSLTESAVPPKARGKVRFNHTNEANDSQNQRSNFPLRDRSMSPSTKLPSSSVFKGSSSNSRNNSVSSLMTFSPDKEKENPFADPEKEKENPFVDREFSSTNSTTVASKSRPTNISVVSKPRPSVLRNSSGYNKAELYHVEEGNEQASSALAAQNRAQRVASLVGSSSTPNSRRNSLDEDTEDHKPPSRRRATALTGRTDDIPLALRVKHRAFDGAESPEDQFSINADYVPRPRTFRGGVLSSLLQLHNGPRPGTPSGSAPASRRNSNDSDRTLPVSLGSSGIATPKKGPKWYAQRNQSNDSLRELVEASAVLAGPANGGTNRKFPRPGMEKWTISGKLLESAAREVAGGPRLEDEIRITVQIAETLSRQRYLLKLCRALMSYGAPTHRLEEYVKISARVLEIDGQFLYIPGCMIISFDDAATHTAEVKLVRSAPGVDLGKLKDIHEIYKEVVHDVIGIEEANQRLDVIIRKPNKFNVWLVVIAYGLASATIAPFAFQGRLIDLPIIVILGCLVGFLRLIVAPKSDLYANVFEISAAVLTSFLSRAFGSIQGGRLFCFSAISQSSIILILPGYTVLLGALELQSRSIVAGSVRMVYAIIYSLFIGFGITIGTAIYGLIDKNATSSTTCQNPMNEFTGWLFVPLFTLCLTIINQAKWKQMPAMVGIAFFGFVANFFSAKKFPSSVEIANTFGALVVGVLGNLYSRLRHGVAAAALLPAIFVLIPNALAASGSLVAGLSSAEQITNNSMMQRINGTSFVKIDSSTDLNTIVFNVGFSMIQVAIGITVGLFLSALIVYPLGKRRSGLFSF